MKLRNKPVEPGDELRKGYRAKRQGLALRALC